MDVLSSIKLVEVPQLVKALAPEEQDVLMKYLYAGMAAPEHNNSGVLLAWHEKVLKSFAQWTRGMAISGTRRRNTSTTEDRLFSFTLEILGTTQQEWAEGKKQKSKDQGWTIDQGRKKYGKIVLLKKFLSLWNLTRLLSPFFCCCC